MIRTRHFAFALAAVGALACSERKTFPASGNGGVDAGGAADATGSMDAGPMGACAPIGEALAMGAAPPRRGDMAYAFDTACNRVFMFSGDDAVPQNCSTPPSAFVDDLWTFDLGTGLWYRLTASNQGPLPRARSVGSWDAARKRFIVFGGRWRNGTRGNYTFLNDVWSYDPAKNEWAELWARNTAGGPSGRMNTMMIEDPTNDQLIVHAGGTTDFDDFVVNSETWAFDLTSSTWAQVGTTGRAPPPRLFHTGAFDKQRRRLYVFTGGGADSFTATTFFRDLWYLDLATDTWSQVTTDASFPAGRIKAKMDYDAANDRLVMFGGHDDTPLGNTNQVWTFDLSAQLWTEEIAGDELNRPSRGQCDFPADFATTDTSSPERREAHLFVIGGNTAFMFGGRTDCGIANDTWKFNLNTLTWEQVNDSFTGLTCVRAGRADCADPNANMCG